MAGSRSTPPLFDLLRQGADRGDEAKPTPMARSAPPPSGGPAPQPRTPFSPKPVMRLETVSRPPPAAPASRPDSPPPLPRPRTSEGPSRPGSRATITVGVVWVWLALAGVLASLLAVWGVAYSMGGSEARDRLGRFEVADTEGLAGGAPGVPGPNVASKPVIHANKGIASPPTNGGGPAVVPKAPTPAFPAADSRVAGYNYLLCASLLDKAAAEAAAGFLTQNGVPAAAVPTKGRAGKFSVYTLLGIPGDSFNEQLKIRNDHKAAVARLGQVWRKERPGSPDFSDALWDKYKP